MGAGYSSPVAVRRSHYADFLDRCFELIGQSLQWFVIHNLTSSDVGMCISKSGNDKFICRLGCVRKASHPAIDAVLNLRFSSSSATRTPIFNTSLSSFSATSRSFRQTLPGHRQPVPRLTLLDNFTQRLLLITIFSPVFQPYISATSAYLALASRMKSPRSVDPARPAATG